MKRNVNKQSGFTIVELVVVIILLGILAATALPRFIDIDDEAHDAAFAGVMGGFSTGVALYHAQWVAEGQAVAGTQISEFANLRTTGNGYPYSFTANGGNIPGISQDCADVMTGVLQSTPTISTGAALANVVSSATDYTAVRNGANCEYYYSAQSNATGQTVKFFSYASASGLVTSSTATLP